MRYKIRALLLAVTALTLMARMTLPVLAQNPVGAIRGVVTDQQGAVIQNANVTVTNKATGDVRKANTGGDGIYLVSALLPGEYEVKIEAQGFATQLLNVLVQVGNTSTGDISMRVGAANEVVDVISEAPVIDKTNYKIDGVITRQKIDALPLNGRNFLQLALLEPGVGVSVGNVGNANNLFNVSIGGASSALTRLTVDGGSILDPVTGGAAQNFSTDTIQEFQISTFQFDLSTGVTSVGAVNIVSRTGTNDFHGSAFIFFRDDQLAAAPGFFRSGFGDPSFQRSQYGGSIGGPIKKDRAWFFGNIEFLDQDAAISISHTGAPAFSTLNATVTSPYEGYLANVRGDFKLTDKHNMFGRFSRDDNNAFAPNGNNRLPSNWRDNRNKDNNAQVGVTSILRQNFVTDVRFNYQRINNVSDIPGEDDCPTSDPVCIGVRGVQIQVNNSNLVIGNETNAPQARILDRYQTRGDVNWQKGAHRIRFGGEWEHNYGKGKWDFFNPALIVLHDPRDVIATNAFTAATINPLPLPAALKAQILAGITIPVPAVFLPGALGQPTLQDILALPLIAGVAGVGDPQQPPPFQGETARQSNRYRAYAQDQWQVNQSFSFLFGASYQYETNLLNHDLDKPELLRALVGDLGRPGKDKNNIAPSLGFTWDVKGNGKTVVRGGAGIYYDTVLFVTRLLERPLTGPAGNGRLSIPTAFFGNPVSFPQLTLGGALAPISALFNVINPAVGANLNFLNNAGPATTLPTKFTGQNLLDALSTQVPQLQGILNQGAAAGFSSIQFIKAADLPATLLDPNLESPYTEQFTIGFQHQLPKNMALSVDLVLRNRVHVTSGFDNALDLNLFNRRADRGGPVLPRCTAAQRTDPSAICSNGAIRVFQSIDRNAYKALLVKLDKRFSNRYQFTASYALSSLRGFFINEDQTDWFGNSGPLDSDVRHRLTFSGVVDLPWNFQASLIAVYASRPPFNARIPSTVDLNGDGTFGDTLPGLEINELGRSVSKDELFGLVTEYNERIARPSAGTIRPLVLPPNFDFGDNFQSHDIRVSKRVKFGESKAIEGLVEVFNVFNIANLGGFSTRLDQGRFVGTVPATAVLTAPTNFNFGQPSLRVGQAFGTGGPRAIQLGARFIF
jgi:hypothetical protein